MFHLLYKHYSLSHIFISTFNYIKLQWAVTKFLVFLLPHIVLRMFHQESTVTSIDCTLNEFVVSTHVALQIILQYYIDGYILLVTCFTNSLSLHMTRFT